MPDCPCGKGKPLIDCCGKFHSGIAHAPTPEALMRSRYSAFYLQDFDYLKKTMLPPAADQFDFDDLAASALAIQWQRLEIIKAKGMSVEFRAYYKEQQQEHVLHEVSEFKFIDGKWFYVNGRHKST